MNIVNKDLLFIAIDGPAPKAKMIQQRQRRFKKFYEKREIDKLKNKHNIPNDNKEEWDTNAITPGLFLWINYQNN